MMAQNALTVTQSNPTPPTNFTNSGATPPNPPQFVNNVYQYPFGDPAAGMPGQNPNPPPYYDDGIVAATPNSRSAAAANGHTLNEASGRTYIAGAVYAAKKAALASEPSNPTPSTSVDHEELGNVTTVTATSANPTGLGQIIMVSDGPVMNTQALRDAGPNARHTSYLSGSAVPTLTLATGASNVAGPGVTVLTVTGTNFNRASVVSISGVPQTTQYVSATSLTVTNAMKKQTAGAGTLPVTVTSNGVTTAPVNWTFT
jgi:hypothetical protein